MSGKASVTLVYVIFVCGSLRVREEGEGVVNSPVFRHCEADACDGFVSPAANVLWDVVTTYAVPEAVLS